MTGLTTMAIKTTLAIKLVVYLIVKMMVKVRFVREDHRTKNKVLDSKNFLVNKEYTVQVRII